MNNIAQSMRRMDNLMFEYKNQVKILKEEFIDSQKGI